jgi:hypothetical protein
MDHDCRLVDERFNPTQTLRKRNHLKVPEKTSRFRLPPFKVKVTMPLKPDICRFANACCG